MCFYHRLITGWLKYVTEYINSPKVLTINMHYLNHVAEAIRQIGPLEMISS